MGGYHISLSTTMALATILISQIIMSALPPQTEGCNRIGAGRCPLSCYTTCAGASFSASSSCTYTSGGSTSVKETTKIQKTAGVQCLLPSSLRCSWQVEALHSTEL